MGIVLKCGIFDNVPLLKSHQILYFPFTIQKNTHDGMLNGKKNRNLFVCKPDHTKY